MNVAQTFAGLFANFGNLTWQMVVMWAIGGLLIYLGIVKKMEPSLLLPMGFGAILVNLPLSGAITQEDTEGPITALFEAGMSNELFPLLLFLQQFLRGGDRLPRRLLDAVAVIQGVVSLVPVLPALVGGLRPLAGADHRPHFVGHFHKGIGVICIGIQFP